MGTEVAMKGLGIAVVVTAIALAATPRSAFADKGGKPYRALPPHHARYFAGRDLVIVDTRTHRVVSIVRNAR